MQSAARGEAGYPPGFDELGSDVPERVWWRGPAWDPSPSAVAIVGARRASERGRSWARALGIWAARHERAVISGGALGIDTAAHEGALEGGGRTCVVLPSPLHAALPARNRPLFDRIVQSGGTVLSPYARLLGRRTFSERNRYIAALAEVVVVVEAGPRSGTLHTVAAAHRLGRTVAGIRFGPADERGAALRALEIRKEALGFDDLEGLIAWLNEGKVSSSPWIHLSGDPIWDLLERPQPLEVLVEAQPEDAARKLFDWELQGWIERRAGRYQRTGST